MTALELVHDLHTNTPPADRCPHLEHDADGCRCRQLAGTTAERMVCDHLSLQLWCLAGPERWPVCVWFKPGETA